MARLAGADFSAREPDAVQFLWNSEAKFILEAHVKEMVRASPRALVRARAPC
jgi:hypothetical protein